MANSMVDSVFFGGMMGSPEDAIKSQMARLQRQRDQLASAPIASASIQGGSSLVASQQIAILNNDIQRQQLAKLDSIDRQIGDLADALKNPMVGGAGAVFQ